MDDLVGAELDVIEDNLALLYRLHRKAVKAGDKAWQNRIQVRVDVLRNRAYAVSQTAPGDVVIYNNKVYSGI